MKQNQLFNLLISILEYLVEQSKFKIPIKKMIWLVCTSSISCDKGMILNDVEYLLSFHNKSYIVYCK